MKISFVIPAYNEENYIGDCLDAIIREKKANAYDVEIVVVDNASTDGTARILKKYAKDVIAVSEPEKGIVRARRAGFLAAHGELIANIDADTRITPGWLAKVMKAFEKDEHLVALSGPFVYYDAPRKVMMMTWFFYHVGFLFYLSNRFIFRIGSMLQGGNYVVRRTALEAIGGYDTNLEFYGEDADVARRLNKMGRVKFTFKLPAYSSGRRLAKEGQLTIGLRYAINYFWIMFFKRPFTKTSVDIRLRNKDSQFYDPENKVKEWAIASSAVFIFLVIVLGGAFVAYSLAETGTVSVWNLLHVSSLARERQASASGTVENVVQEKTNGPAQ